MNKIAIIIPCYNHAKELGETLESLTRQTRQPDEVVVVDNGSDDHPETIVQKYSKVLPIKVIRFTERRGAPAARNFGAKQTVSDNMMFLDSDVSLVPDALSRMSEALEHDTDASFAYSNFYWDFKRFAAQPWNPDALRRLNFIHTTTLIRRRDFPGFDENLKKFQDWDLWLTMAEKGLAGTFVDEYLFRVKQHRAGISSWLPSFAHKLPWPILGWIPNEIRKYRETERIIREKHKI